MDRQEIEALKRAWDHFFETVARPLACLACGGAPVWWDGTRTRTASVRLGEETVHIGGIRCRRVRCADAACRHRWCLFPPGLLPRRHFQACVVAAATQEYLYAEGASQEGTAARHGCCRRTLHRWLGWLSSVAEPAAIQERILLAEGEPILAPFRAVAELARKGRTEVRRKALELAGVVLAHLEALAVALGLEPPGLKSVLETVAWRGVRQSTQKRPLLPEFARRPDPTP